MTGTLIIAPHARAQAQAQAQARAQAQAQHQAPQLAQAQWYVSTAAAAHAAGEPIDTDRRGAPHSAGVPHPPINDCEGGGGPEGGFVEGVPAHSPQSHAEHGGGGADGGYGGEGGDEDLGPAEEGVAAGAVGLEHQDVAHEGQDASLHLAPLAPEQHDHEHPDAELRHGGGSHEPTPHDGCDEGGHEGAGEGSVGCMHEEEDLQFVPASPHSHGANVVASVEFPLQGEGERDRDFDSHAPPAPLPPGVLDL